MLCWGVTVTEASLLFLTSLSSERHTPALWMGGRNAVCVCVCVCVCVGGGPVSCPLVHIKLNVRGTSLVVQW